MREQYKVGALLSERYPRHIFPIDETEKRVVIEFETSQINMKKAAVLAESVASKRIKVVRPSLLRSLSFGKFDQWKSIELPGSGGRNATTSEGA